MVSSKTRHWRTPSARQQLSFLILLAAAWGTHSAQAATIYQCKQADGRVAFQEMPCAATATQAEVGKTTHAAPPRAPKAPTAAAPAAPTAAATTEPATAAKRDPNVCVTVGREVYSIIKQSHPQAAMQACKKHLEMFANNMACLQTCVETWITEYKKHQTAQ